VHLFQSKLCSFLSIKLKDLTKIYYFSDAAASQYIIRKNFINLYRHKADFHMDAGCNFFAILHGKGERHGTGGTTERAARKASLQNLYKEQMKTLRQLGGLL
jgi:hypothetical protein